MLENISEIEGQEYLPLRDVVFCTLRDAILKGEIAPGERLMEIHIANKLGVSRTPVREAIHMLEQEGLANTSPHRGAHVARMSQKDLEDVLEVRDALDLLAVKKACDNMNADHYAKLHMAVDNFKQANESGDYRRIVQADEDFHNIIYNAANNTKLLNLINNLKEQMYRFRFEYIKSIDNHDELVREHEAIVNALENKNRELAAEWMHKHLKNQIEAVRAYISGQEKA